MNAGLRSPIDRWALDPHVVHLNHGSYGGCLRSVVAAAAAWRERLEKSPMRFFCLDWQTELDRARGVLAEFVRAPVERTAFVTGATTGIAIALQSIRVEAGDEIVITDHGYRAVKNQVERLAAARGAKITTISIGLPFDPDAIVDAYARVSPKARVAIVDHVTSPTALRMPVERIVPVLRERGVITILDGAHAPGQLDVDVSALGATYYVGNCHKWICAPKGSGFIVVADDAPAVPVITSHGASPEYGPPNRLHAELDWAGTHDPTVHLTVPTAIADVGAEGGGWAALRARNHAMAIEMRKRFVEALARFAARPAPIAADDHIGAMVAIPIALPGGTALELQTSLLEAGWEVPVVEDGGGGYIRLSAHLYNHAAEAEDLARELHGRGVRLR